MIVTLTLNPGLDLTYTLVESRVGEVDVHRATTATMEASGKGVNVSRALHANRIRTVAVLPLGGSTGHHLSELLLADGVPHRVVDQVSDTRVNTTIAVAGGETAKVNGPGGTLTSESVDLLRREVAAALGGDTADGDSPVGDSAGDTPGEIPDDGSGDGERWLAICGSLPPGVEPSLVGELVELAHAHGARCAIDASGEALAVAIDAGADLLAPNRIELAEVEPGAASTGASGSVAELGTAAAALARRTGTSYLVSLGRDGALFTDGDLVVHGHGPALVPVNTAGAGDALLSGWLAGPGSAVERMTRAIRWSRAACLAPTTVAPALPEGEDDDIVVDVITKDSNPTRSERAFS